MKRITRFLYIVLIIVFHISCKQDIHSPENLLTANSHIEDSIIFNVPKSPRLCDGMNVEKQKIDIGNCKLYYEIEGEGVPMVLIHGGPGGTHHCFHPWLSGAKDKFKIIYYDQRGCGQSDFKAGEGYSFEQTVDDLENLRKALKMEKWIVLGHSFGGGIAQYYTIKYPENVIGQVLVGSVPMMKKPELNVTNEHQFLNKQEIQKLDTILKLTLAGKLTYQQYFYNNDINGGWKRENFLKPAKERHAQLASYDIVFDKNLSTDFELYDFEQAFENCPIPTLICEGKYDSLWTSKKIPALLKNHPNAKFRHFEKSSHNIYSDEPEELIEFISEWSDSLKVAGNIEINAWKTKTKEILGEPLKLIQNNKTFIKLIKNDGIIAAKKYYEDFKKTNPGKTLFLENSLNIIGYQYLRSDKIEIAISIFEMIAKEYPQSWNAFDSLGEAYMKSGNKKPAIENYEKSLKLNPDSESGKAALEKLKGK